MKKEVTIKQGQLGTMLMDVLEETNKDEDMKISMVKMVVGVEIVMKLEAMLFGEEESEENTCH